MGILQIIGYFGALVVGISLGLIGGGGSILTVPILVYLFRVSPVLATSYSLFVVGISSGIGSLSYIKKKLVNFKIIFLFALPSLVSVYMTRAYVVPSLPDYWFTIRGLEITKNLAILILFAILMILAAFSMIQKKDGIKNHEKETKVYKAKDYFLIGAEGMIVGFFTGLVGAGGGFLIIPALVILGGISMKEAIGSSLVIISVKSLIGFTGDIANQPIDWNFLGVFSLFAIAGIFIGIKLSSRISNKKLKEIFGWFVLIMGTFILTKELFL